MATNLNVTHQFGNSTGLRGHCPVPFLDAEKFIKKGGHVEGRLCAPVPNLMDHPNCCLPCPATDWLYPNDFKTWYKVSESISVVGLVICVFLMLSWAFLPVEKSRRHWLSICLVVGIIMESLAFVIPLGAKPDQCFDEITPNDMHTSTTCAFTGAFIVGGGCVVTVWIFIRALSMHLQICWDIVPGVWYFYTAQAVGWGVVTTLFTLTMTLTGVSFRFGDTCHVNTDRSMSDFWGPLLGIASATGLIQILTFLYCIKVYLRNIWSDDQTETNGSAGLPSYHSSMGTHSARAVYQRVKKVLWLQWRSITIVIFLLVDIVFLAIVWVQLNATLEAAKAGKMEHFVPFLLCLVSTGGVKESCYAAGQKAIINEGTAIAILMLLSLTGVQTGLMMSRATMFAGWYELLRRKLGSKREFVSLDAERYSHDQRTIELLKVGASPSTPRTPGEGEHYTMERAAPKQEVRYSPSPPEYPIPDAERVYRNPALSFSHPQTPSRQGHRSDWNSEESYSTANGGLASHPPSSPDKPHPFSKPSP